MEAHSTQDRQQLQLLGAFYQIMGAIAWAVAFVLLFVLKRSGAPFNMNAVLCGLLLGIGVSLFVAGRQLKRCLNYVFCMGMATFACFFFPFGTIIGILTFVVMSRPTVKQLFRN